MNMEELSDEMVEVDSWAEENKLEFSPTRTELFHITRKRHQDQPSLYWNGQQITPITRGLKKSKMLGLRWLGYWFDRQRKGWRHVDERTAAAMVVANHIRRLGAIKKGPPPYALRKAVLAIVTPMVTYATNGWYRGVDQQQTGLLHKLNKPLTYTARGILPGYKTTLHTVLLMDAGLPSAEVAMEHERMRLAYRLKLLDTTHPLVQHLEDRPKLQGGPH